MCKGREALSKAVLIGRTLGHFCNYNHRLNYAVVRHFDLRRNDEISPVSSIRFKRIDGRGGLNHISR